MADVSTTGEASKKTAEVWDTYRQTMVSGLKPESIMGMPETQLIAIEIAPGNLGSALKGPVITLPSEWLAAGISRQLAQRSIDLARALPDSIDVTGTIAKNVFLTLRRIMLALWLIPYVGTGKSLPKPRTWLLWCKHLVRITHFVLSRRPPADGQIFAHLNLDDMAAILQAVPGDSTRSLFTRLTQFKHRGLWQDWPDINALERCQGSGPGREKSRKGLEKPLARDKKSQQWQPLPDAFVTEFGWRSKWIIEQLGASLLDCFEACLAVSEGCPATIMKWRKAIIAGWNWRTPGGEAITKLPFPIRLDGLMVETWPPPHYEALQQAVFVLQGTNLFVTSLSMGGRTSDVLSLGESGLRMAGAVAKEVADFTGEGTEKFGLDGSSARVAGRTFKLVERVGGAVREWPLSAVGVNAFTLQQRLARLLRPVGADHLWVCLSSAHGEGVGSPLNNASNVFNSLVDKFGLREMLGDVDSFHHHRCRKTIARLVGLALVGAPKILMDLFGHKTIEMTLSYILSDPDFAAEVQEVAKAQIIIMGKQAIESVDANGGVAAGGLRTGVEREKARLGEDQFQADGVTQMAEILTLNGKSCQLVRPGVICTKSPGEMGPCAKGTARIDPSRCKSDCGHRLELAALRDDVDRSIAEAVQYLQQAMADSDDCMIEFWRGQLQHHLSRFPDIRDKWMDQPALADLLAGVMEDAA